VRRDIESMGFPAGDGAEPPARRSGRAFKVGVAIVLAVLIIPFGVPRFLAGNDTVASSRVAARVFTKVCRDHGGTPSTRTLTGTTAAQRVCTVRYGGQVYVMDAITPKGFDDDTARFQRQGCSLARQEQRGETARDGKGVLFVYHPDTGVCEHRA
jgi:hypothetical protein